MYDEYSTPARGLRVTLAHTTRIGWCCLFSYLISELRRDGLWACPQLRSYSWWGCEYNVYLCWWNYTFNLLGEVDVCELYYWPDRVFSRSSRRCSSFDLSLGSFEMVDLCLWDAQSRWHHFLESFTTPMCMPIVWTGHFNSCMFMINYWLLYHQAAW